MKKGIIVIIVLLVAAICGVGALALKGREVQNNGPALGSEPGSVTIDEPYIEPEEVEAGPNGPQVIPEGVEFEDMDDPDYVMVESPYGEPIVIGEIDGAEIYITTKGKFNYLRVMCDAFAEGSVHDLSKFEVNGVDYTGSDRFGFNQESSRLVLNDNGPDGDLPDVSVKGVNNLIFVYKGVEYTATYEVKEVD